MAPAGAHYPGTVRCRWEKGVLCTCMTCTHKLPARTASRVLGQFTMSPQTCALQVSAFLQSASAMSFLGSPSPQEAVSSGALGEGVVGCTGGDSSDISNNLTFVPSNEAFLWRKLIERQNRWFQNQAGQMRRDDLCRPIPTEANPVPSWNPNDKLIERAFLAEMGIPVAPLIATITDPE